MLEGGEGHQVSECFLNFAFLRTRKNLVDDPPGTDSRVKLQVERGKDTKVIR